jgi:VanZ family protein
MSLPDRLKPEWRHRLFVAYAVAMALVFLTPAPDTGIQSRYLDKAVHFALFCGFALAYQFDRGTGPGRMFVMSTAFAAAVELIQWVLPFREGDWGDLVAGAAGAAVASVPVLLIARRTRDVAGEAPGRRRPS